jgi:hypothetical protein
MASYYIKTSKEPVSLSIQEKMNFIKKVDGTSFTPHKKTVGKINTSKPTSNVFLSNLDTLFQNS